MPRISYSPKRQQVLEALREAIASGQLAPGQRIVEQQLARELGVSQTPVREALASLEREGIVIKVDHTGTFVSSLEPEALKEVLTLRAVLEGYCAALVSAQLTDDTLKPLERIVEQMRAAAEAGDLRRTTLLDARFHEALYGICSHGLLREELARLYQRMMLSVAFVDLLQETDLHGIADNHVYLLEAIATGEPETAERVARGHVLGILDDIDGVEDLDLGNGHSAIIAAVLQPSDEGGNGGTDESD